MKPSDTELLHEVLQAAKPYMDTLDTLEDWKFKTALCQITWQTPLFRYPYTPRVKKEKDAFQIIQWIIGFLILMTSVFCIQNYLNAIIPSILAILYMAISAFHHHLEKEIWKENLRADLYNAATPPVIISEYLNSVKGYTEIKSWVDTLSDKDTSKKALEHYLTTHPYRSTGL